MEMRMGANQYGCINQLVGLNGRQAWFVKNPTVIANADVHAR